MAAKKVHEYSSKDAETEVTVAAPNTERQNWLKRAWHAYVHHKKWSIPATILVFVAMLLAIPVTRYPILGMYVTQKYIVTVADATTHTPVSSATVMIDGKKVATNNKGQATIRSHIGKQTVHIAKRYYASTHMQIFVGISSKHNTQAVHMTATGRQVPIMVVNAISKKAVENASVSAGSTVAKTDKQGRAIITLPTSAATQAATITANGYNKGSAKIEVTSATVNANTLAITPSGKAYFLSNANGTMDVVSANLDGTDRKVVVAGTGKETPGQTFLKQTDDSQFLALQSRRDGGQYDKLFLINATTGQLSTIDEGDAGFSAVGWAGHRLIYTVYRDHTKYWEAKRFAIKSYNADAKKLSTLTENTSDGDENNHAYQSIANVYVVDASVLYSVSWSGTDSFMNGRAAQIVRINSDGSSKKVLKEVSQQPQQNTYISSRATKPQEIYFNVEQNNYREDNNQNTYLHYANNAVSVASESTGQAALNQVAINYYASPSGDQSFWSESRDGKYTLFIGDQKGDNAKQIASLSDYEAYGWASSSYVLVSKDDDGLFVISVNGGPALKVSDYYATNQQRQQY